MASKKPPTSESAQQRQYGLFQLEVPPTPYRKPVQVLHSLPKAPMTLIQRKLQNAWLRNAVMTKPDEQGWWSINASTMMEDIGFDSKATGHLADAARKLMAIVFEWDLIAEQQTKQLKRHTPVFKASVLFPEVEIIGSVFRYQISNQLQPLVLNPHPYAIIDLSMIRKLNTGPSVALYEHCVRFINIGTTTAIPWRLLRDMLLGTGHSETYEEFKYFNSRKLKRSIAEINAQTDITVETIPIKSGRVVELVQFTVKRKADAPLNPDDDIQLQIIGEMIQLGIPQSEARKLSRSHPYESICAAIEYTKQEILKKSSKGDESIKNPGAYLRRAIQDGWGLTKEESSDPKNSAPSSQSIPKPTVLERFTSERRIQASKYFEELDLSDQSALIERYNSTQEIDSLKIKKSRPGKGAEVSFMNWLAELTWGKPTSEELLAYAEKLL